MYLFLCFVRLRPFKRSPRRLSSSFFKYLLRPDVRTASAASLETPPERTEQQQRPKKSEQDGAAAAAVPPSTAAVPGLETGFVEALTCNKQVAAQPRVQVTNIAGTGNVILGALSDGTKAVRIKFMRQASLDARAQTFIKGSIVVLVSWEVVESVSASSLAQIIVTNVRIETRISGVIGTPELVPFPLPAGEPALDKMKKQNAIRKQEQNLLGRIASGEDTRLLKEKILEHTEQHGRLGRASLAAALQAGAAARGAGSAAAAAPVPAATGLMDPTGDSYVQECMTYDPDSPWMGVIGECPWTAWNLGPGFLAHCGAAEMNLPLPRGRLVGGWCCCCCWRWGGAVF